MCYINNNEVTSKVKYKLYSKDTNVWIDNRIAKPRFENEFSFERFMDERFPYLPTVEYKKPRPIRNDTDYLDNLVDL